MLVQQFLALYSAGTQVGAEDDMLSICQWILILSLFVASSSSVNGAEGGSSFSGKGRLTLEEIGHLKDCKRLLQDVDQKSFMESRLKIEKSAHPHENLQLFAAVAQTYDDIVHEQKIIDQPKKEFLLMKINFNMAYLQLAGINTEQRQDTGLNKMIRRKLREHLPVDLKKNFTLFRPME